jgi:hypothetical protein
MTNSDFSAYFVQFLKSLFCDLMTQMGHCFHNYLCIYEESEDVIANERVNISVDKS